MPLLQHSPNIQTLSECLACHHPTAPCHCTELSPRVKQWMLPAALVSTLFLLTSAAADAPAQTLLSPQPAVDTITTLMGSRALQNRRVQAKPADAISSKISLPASLLAHDRMTSLAEPLPNDPYAELQWNLMATDDYGGGANIFNTPEHNRNQHQVIVAVVDSGVLLTHEDFSTLPGYDFVHDPVVGNDGDGRDNDPTDPGDWVSESDVSLKRVTSSCRVTPSKWHGTAIAGVIGANADNQLGIAGASGFASLLPVRITGKCGGYVNDLIDGIRWAAGLPVAGVPHNPHPARIINLSVGFPGSCSSRLQSAIDDANNNGAILIAAATNNPVSLDDTPYSPASCKNVLSVSAVLRDGLLATYSARGSDVFILGPGGASYDGIISTDNAGLEHAEIEGNYGYHFGTSLAAAHVSAALATLLSIEPSLDNNALQQLLIQSASAVPDDPACKSGGCGHGRLNTNRAVRLLLNPDNTIIPVVVADDDATAAPGKPVASAALNDESFGLGNMDLSVFLLLLLITGRRCRLNRLSTGSRSL